MVLPIPRVLQISDTVRDLSEAMFLSICTCLAESAFGRPPALPLLLAAVSPARVRSRIISRSNSARAPKIWKTSFPPDVVVSMSSCRDLKLTPLSSSAIGSGNGKYFGLITRELLLLMLVGEALSFCRQTASDSPLRCHKLPAKGRCSSPKKCLTTNLFFAMLV